MKKINLNSLLKMPSHIRNCIVFNLYDDKTNIINLYGDIEGILIDENFEIVLKESNIDLIDGNEYIVILKQYNDFYYVKNKQLESYKKYLDFSIMNKIGNK